MCKLLILNAEILIVIRQNLIFLWMVSKNNFYGLILVEVSKSCSGNQGKGIQH
jgi:hypothetical protein